MGQKFCRNELYELLWSEPKAALAKRLSISDVGLGKACKKANIPVPPRGYWAAKNAGRPVARLPLPLRGFGQSDQVTIGPGKPRYHYNEEIGELPSPPVFAESVDEVIERARRQIGKVSVPKSLESPHHLVANLLVKDDERRRKAAESGYYWDRPHFELPAAKRRLRLINAIFMALTRVGFKPMCNGKGAGDLTVCIGEVWIRFSIEPLKASKLRDFLFDENNGNPRQPLRINLSSTRPEVGEIRKEWMDAEGKPLEDAVANVVLSLVVMGELHYRAGEQRHYEWLKERKAEQEEEARKAKELAERKAREAILAREKGRRDRLCQQASDWEMAMRLRAFVAAVLQQAGASGQNELLTQWSTWALGEADALDPLRTSAISIAGSELAATDGREELDVELHSQLGRQHGDSCCRRRRFAQIWRQ